MPRRKHRSYYPAVTFSVIIVGIMGMGGAALRKFIPKPPLNPLAEERDPFLVQAGTQAIPWRKLDRASLAEARRADKPIYLVIGEASSRIGQLADLFSLVDSETTEFIRREFIPIRVDATAQPYLAAAFDPVRRSQDGWDPSFQVWYLNSEGFVVSGLLPTSPQVGSLPKNLFGSAQYVAQQIREMAKPDSIVDPAGTSQAAQAQLLLGSGSRGRPDFASHLSWLLSNRDPLSSGWPTTSGEQLRAAPLQFLLASGDEPAFFQSLDAIVTSGMVDWINGGFFSQARQAGWREIDYDKYAATNADLVEVFAKAHALNPKPIYQKVAQDGFDALADRFAKDGIIRAYRFEDRVGNNRSARSSFSPRYLNDHFDDERRSQIKRVFSLDPVPNPEMLLKVTSTDAYNGSAASVSDLLEALRASRVEPLERYSEQQVANVSCAAVARLLGAARFLDDPERLSTARYLFDQLKRYRSGENDVLRRADGRDEEVAFLGDYLAYGDAALQMYLVSGDPEHLQESVRVTQRAVELFEVIPGVLSNASPELKKDLPPDTLLPEVVDRNTTSTAAVAIRLLTQLGWILGDIPDGAQFRRFAREGVYHYGPLANEYQRGFSGLFEATLLYDRMLSGRVVGRDAVQLAAKWQRLHPAALIFPVPSEEATRFEVIRGAVVTPFANIQAASEALEAATPPL